MSFHMLREIILALTSKVLECSIMTLIYLFPILHRTIQTSRKLFLLTMNLQKNVSIQIIMVQRQQQRHCFLTFGILHMEVVSSTLDLSQENLM